MTEFFKPKAKAKRRITQRPEQGIQIACVKLADSWLLPFSVEQERGWAARMVGRKVGDYLFHIPNGGGRSKVEGGIFKAMGVRSGVSDLFLMLPLLFESGPIAGLFIELKAGKGSLTSEQSAFQENAEFVGYETATVRSVFEFQVVIEAYVRPSIGMWGVR